MKIVGASLRRHDKVMVKDLANVNIFALLFQHVLKTVLCIGAILHILPQSIKIGIADRHT